MNDVAIFAPKYPPDVGGAAVYFKQVVEQLDGSKWRPTVFAPRREDAPTKETIANDGTLYRCFPNGSIHGALYVPQCVRLLRSTPFECAHIHPHFPQWRFYRWVVKAVGIPRIYDCRDRKFARRYVRDGSAYLSAADHIDGILRAEGVDGNKILRSPVVTDIPDDLPTVRYDTTGTDIGFVGDLTGAKGVKLAIEGVRQYLDQGNDAHLHIYGDGLLRDYVTREADANDWITYHGPVKHARALAAIRALDAIVLPSKTEGRPRVVLEAHELGTPVVATRAGSIPDIVDGRSVLTGRGAEHIANGIKRCLENNHTALDGGGVECDTGDVREVVTSIYTAVGE